MRTPNPVAKANASASVRQERGDASRASTGRTEPETAAPRSAVAERTRVEKRMIYFWGMGLLNERLEEIKTLM